MLTDVLGISIGHIYYYLQDVFPYLPGGFRILKTPRILVYLFNPGQYYLDRLETQVININSTANAENVQTNSQASGRTTDQSNAADSPATSSSASNGTATTESKDNQELRNRAVKSDDKSNDQQTQAAQPATVQPTASQPAASQPNGNAEGKEQRPAHEHQE